MANFPNNPSTDETFVSRDSTIWTWTGASWRANSALATGDEVYINYTNDGTNNLTITAENPLTYSDGAELYANVVVTRGYTKCLIELEGSFSNDTDPTAESYLELQRRIGVNLWQPVQNVLISSVESNGTAFQAIYKTVSIRVLDEHGADTGDSVSYKFINNTGDVLGIGPTSIRAYYNNIPTTLSVKEIK